MSKFKPLVLDSTADTLRKQLQVGDELDIPLDERFNRLQNLYGKLLLWMIDQRFNLPDEQLQYLQEIPL